MRLARSLSFDLQNFLPFAASLVFASFLLHGAASAQNPQPIFPVTTLISIPDLASSPVVADFNNDGVPDLAYVGSPASGQNGTFPLSLNIVLGFGSKASTTVTTPLCSSPQGGAPIAVGDVNKDGKPDVVVTCNGYIMVLLGNGDGSFQAPSYYALNTGQTPVLVDLNGDGYLDIAVLVPATSTPSQIAIFLNKGNAGPGLYGTPQMYAAGAAQTSPYNLLPGDFNGDGKQDLIASSTSGFLLFFGNGDGTLQQMQLQSFPTPQQLAPYFVVGDFNHDGITDVAWVPYLPPSPSVQILFGSTSGTLVPGPTLQLTPSNPPANVDYLTAADLTGNGNLDLVVGDDLTYIFLNDGKGNFTQTASYSVSGPALVADVNQDGKPDLLFQGVPEYGIYVVLGNGDGTFQAVPGTHVAGPSADINGDGIADMVDIVPPPNGQTGQSSIATGLGRGDGTFGVLSQTASIPGQSLSNSYFLELGDFNGDGKIDAVAVQPGYPGPHCYPGTPASQDAELFSYIGNGNGTFQAKGSGLDLGAIAVVAQGVVGDFNGDGNPDLILPYYSFSSCMTPQGLLFIPGNGDGTFGTPVEFSSASGNINNLNIVAGDLNHDGKLDFIWSYNNAVYLGNGNGTFQQLPLNVQIPQSAPIALADMNGDGILDLIAGASIYAGNGDGSFQTTPLYTAPLPQYSSVLSVAAGNVAGDGNPDLLEMYTNPSLILSQISLSIGDGRGNFSPDPNTYFAGLQTQAPATASSLALTRLNNSAPISGDQALDLLSSVDGVYVSSLLNQLNPAPGKAIPFTSTTALTASSTSAATGASITLTATVTGINPTGSVYFTANATSLGTAPISNGMATLQTSFDNPGSYTATASYAGDQNNSASDSNPVSIAVANPDFMLSAQPAAATISPGQWATFTFTVTPAGGFAGTVKFSCGALPSEATCAFSSATVTPKNGATASTTLTITTTAASSASLGHDKPFAPWIPTASLALAGLLSFAVTPRKSRRWNRLLRVLSAVVFLVAIFLPLSGCGSGSTHPPTNPGTPPGSYTISVNAADGANGLQHAAPVTLTVQ